METTNSEVIRKYYDNGNLEEIYFLINNKKNGLYALYSSNGDKIRTIEYVNGMKNGYYISYQDRDKDNNDITIFYQCSFFNNIKVGKSTFYHKNGNIDNICNYKNDKISGMRYWYSIDGFLVKKCNYINGLRQGKCIFYNRDGSIKYFIMYIDDEVSK